jgi:hypothetical protein
MALYTYIHRECPVKIWGISSGQRIERVLKPSGKSTLINDLGVVKSNDSVLIFDGGYLFDDRLIRYLAATRPDLQLQAEGKRLRLQPMLAPARRSSPGGDWGNLRGRIVARG